MVNEEQISLFDLGSSSEPIAPKEPPKDFDPDLIPTSAKIPVPIGTYQAMEHTATSVIAAIWVKIGLMQLSDAAI